MTPKMWATLILLVAIVAGSSAATWFLFASPRIDAAVADKALVQKDLDAAKLRVSELELAAKFQEVADEVRAEEVAKASAERAQIMARLNQIRSRIDVVAEQQGEAFVGCLGMPVRDFHDRVRARGDQAGAGADRPGN